MVAYAAEAAPLLPAESFSCVGRWAHAGVTLSGLAEAADGALLRLLVQSALPGAPTDDIHTQRLHRCAARVCQHKVS